MARVRWLHELPDMPCVLFAELDDERWEVRKVDVFANGHMESASIEGFTGTDLAEAETPPLEELAANPEFERAA